MQKRGYNMACSSLIPFIVFIAVHSFLSRNVMPMFINEMTNITVPTGREATFTCIIEDIDGIKVAFLRVDTQTILTIDETIITRSPRIGVRHSTDRPVNSSSSSSISNESHPIRRKTWQMTLKDVSPSDAGAYMCQLNIEPMISQVAYLNVNVPPDILVNQSSSDIILTEGQNATLRCRATGFPQPNITWRREDYLPIIINQNTEALVVEGSTLYLTSVRRQQMAAYLCIASNGIPPPVSKRILLKINFAPEITTKLVNVEQRLGEKLVLHCQCWSWPQGFTFWSIQTDRLPSEKQGIDYRTQVDGAVSNMYLTINEMLPQDQGNYTCHCSNSYGSDNRTITVSGIALKLMHKLVHKMKMPWDSNEELDDGVALAEETSTLPPTTTTTARLKTTPKMTTNPTTYRPVIMSRSTITSRPMSTRTRNLSNSLHYCDNVLLFLVITLSVFAVSTYQINMYVAS